MPQWRLVERVPGAWSEIIRPDGEDVLGEWIKADAAALIIRAVNAHDALVEALAESARIWRDGDPCFATGCIFGSDTGGTVYHGPRCSRARAALKLATEGP